MKECVSKLPLFPRQVVPVCFYRAYHWELCCGTNILIIHNRTRGQTEATHVLSINTEKRDQNVS